MSNASRAPISPTTRRTSEFFCRGHDTAATLALAARRAGPAARRPRRRAAGPARRAARASVAAVSWPRQKNSDVLLVVGEIGARDALDIGGGHRAHALEKAVLLGVATDQLEAPEQGRAAMDRVVLEHE